MQVGECLFALLQSRGLLPACLDTIHTIYDPTCSSATCYPIGLQTFLRPGGNARWQQFVAGMFAGRAAAAGGGGAGQRRQTAEQRQQRWHKVRHGLTALQGPLCEGCFTGAVLQGQYAGSLLQGLYCKALYGGMYYKCPHQHLTYNVDMQPRSLDLLWLSILMARLPGPTPLDSSVLHILLSLYLTC